MNKREALQAMLDGKKIKGRNFNKDGYCYYDDLKFRFMFSNGNESEPVRGSLNSIDGYELYEEPKKPRKVMFYEWINTAGFIEAILVTHKGFSLTFGQNEDFSNKFLKWTGFKTPLEVPHDWEGEE